jgi:hypothetical protein
MIAASAGSPYTYFTNESVPIFASQGLQDGIIGQYGGVTQARRMIEKNGHRTQDMLVECPAYAHGYPFTSSCTSKALRQWLCGVFGLQC